MRAPGALCLVSACLLAAAAVRPAAATDKTARVGNVAPAFNLEDADGRQIDSRRFANRPMYINFFASWCPPCKQELPNVVRQYPRFRGRVAFIGVDEQESPAAVKAFLRRMRIEYPVGIDAGAAGAVYGVASLPQSVFVDRHGIVRRIWRGFMPPSVFAQSMALIGVR
jgi:thiol-disulfide isomerase/thioredoxin